MVGVNYSEVSFLSYFTYEERWAQRSSTMAINIISFFILGVNVVVGLVLIVVARFKPTWWHWELFLDWGGTAAISVTSVLVDDLVTAVNRYVCHCRG